MKKLFCLNCNKEVNHVEVVEHSKYNKAVFIDEYKSGNFDKLGNRVIPLKEWMGLYYGSFEHENENNIEDTSIEEWYEIFQIDKRISA